MKITVKPGLWLMLLIVLSIGIGASVLLWSFLRGQETRRAQTLLASASGNLQDRVQAELDHELGSLQRMASKWQIRPAMDRTEWEFDARQVLESHPSLLAVSWLPNPISKEPVATTDRVLERMKVDWALPSIYSQAVVRLHGLLLENRPELLRSVVEQRRMRISDPIFVANRGKAFVVYVPSVVDGEFRGAVVGLFHLQLLLDFVFDRLLASDYSIRLMDGYDTIYERGEGKTRLSDWEHHGELNVFSGAYRLRLWPNPEVQRGNEKFADLALIGGIGVSALLTLLVYFAAKRPTPKLERVPFDMVESRHKLEDRLRVWEATLAGVEEPLFVAENERVMGAGPIVQYVNSAFCRISGHTADELVGRSPRALFVDRFPAAEQPMEMNTQLVRPGEATQPVRLRIRPVRNAQQTVTHWVASIGTEVLPLEKLIAAAPLAVQVFNILGEVLHWNLRAEALTGMRAVDVVGRALPLGVTFPTPPHPTRHDLHTTHADGKRLDLAIWTTPLESQDGTYISFMTDVTAEHEQIEASAEREACFKALVENATDVLAILDLDAKLRYVNPAVEALFGLKPATLIGLSADALLDPTRLDAHVQPIEGSRNLILAGHAVRKDSHNLLEEISDAVLTFDADRRIRWMNPAAAQLFGLDRTHVAGRTLGELLPQWLQSPGWDAIFDALDLAGTYEGDVSFYTPEGREIVQSLAMSRTRDGAVAIHRDVTEKRSAVETFTVDQDGAEALWDWNLRNGEVYYSPRWKAMLGYDDDDITGELEEWFLLVHPDDVHLLRGRITTYLKGQQEHLEVEYRARTRAGAFRWMRTRAAGVRTAAGEVTRLVGIQYDIHDQKLLDEQLLFEAFHDPITGLDNRALFLDRVQGALAAGGAPFAVLFLDLKQFHKVNELVGRRGGDRVLAEAGRRISASMPPDSMVARHSSDEFVVMTPVTEGLDDLIALVRSRLVEPLTIGGKAIWLECSAGFALSSTVGMDTAEAMVQAASRPRERGKVLRNGEHFEAGEFRVFYHPIVSLVTGEIEGMEALVRWQHPQRGLMLPVEFFETAEKGGWLLTMDRWVMREACAKIAELNERFARVFPLVLIVNLSPMHFETREGMEALEQILVDAGVQHGTLRIELNGTGAAPEVGEEYAHLAAAIDAGAVKLPLGLVRGLATGRHVEEARAIIGEARRHNLKVVAEGVESLEQLAVLRELQCDLAQGFYFTQPASSKDTERLLARSPRW